MFVVMLRMIHQKKFLDSKLKLLFWIIQDKFKLDIVQYWIVTLLTLHVHSKRSNPRLIEEQERK
jgi:hypothetical protein